MTAQQIPESQLERALRETKDHVQKTLNKLQATWPPEEASRWIDKNLTERYERAIDKSGGDWELHREYVLSRAGKMVDLAVELSGENRIVKDDHADHAFEDLHCDRKRFPSLAPGVAIWCE